MRKKTLPHQGEASFLKKRRAAVSTAVAKSKSAKLKTPGWMKGLSRRLWSGSHTNEISFNRAKLKKRKLAAFQKGQYLPASAHEKQALQEDLTQYEEKEKKKRREWEKKISRCCWVALGKIIRASPHPFQIIANSCTS